MAFGVARRALLFSRDAGALKGGAPTGPQSFDRRRKPASPQSSASRLRFAASTVTLDGEFLKASTQVAELTVNPGGESRNS
jgi:hypothetical protein